MATLDIWLLYLGCGIWPNPIFARSHHVPQATPWGVPEVSRLISHHCDLIYGSFQWVTVYKHWDGLTRSVNQSVTVYAGRHSMLSGLHAKVMNIHLCWLNYNTPCLSTHDRKTTEKSGDFAALWLDDSVYYCAYLQPLFNEWITFKPRDTGLCVPYDTKSAQCKHIEHIEHALIK